MRLNTVTLGPWKNGLHRDPVEYPAGFTPVAENVVFRNDGRADGLHDLSAASLPASDVETPTARVVGGTLQLKSGEVLGDGFVAPFYWDSYGIEVLATSSRLATLAPEPKVWARNRPVFTLTEEATGNLVGRTGFVVVKDGICSAPQYTEAKGVTILAPPGSSIYATRPDGEHFYFVETGPDSGSFFSNITEPPTGAVLPVEVLTTHPIPLGGPVTVAGGRLFVARGRAVHYSRPFTLGASTPLGFYAVPEPVRMVAGVNTSLFIGTARGVYSVRNAGASEGAAITQVASTRVLSHSFVRVPGEVVGLQASDVVAWMTEAGIQFGLPDGSVQTPHGGAVKFVGPELGVLTFHDGTFFYFSRG